MAKSVTGPLESVADELRNFEEIVKNIIPLPGEVPNLQGIEVYGATMALNGLVGGDHIIYVDFKQRYDLEARIREALQAGRLEVVANLERCRRMAGIAVIDVAGHRATDAALAAMLHQAFLLGSLYELDRFGHITKRLFENLNTRFYHSSSLNKYVTMLYGEIAEDATFRFLSAGHPLPAVFSSRHERFMDVGDSVCTFPPIGTLPSNDIDRKTSSSVLGFKDQYQTNEWTLMGAGDILLLFTDGLSEHFRDNEPYFPGHLEQLIRRVKHQSAKDIVQAIRSDVLSFAPLSDDTSFVVIKRTR
jgi:serine phosphatase RsbU (regulator of sigma subunit)